jgi:hypothetical protein
MIVWVNGVAKRSADRSAIMKLLVSDKMPVWMTLLVGLAAAAGTLLLSPHLNAQFERQKLRTALILEAARVLHADAAELSRIEGSVRSKDYGPAAVAKWDDSILRSLYAIEQHYRFYSQALFDVPPPSAFIFQPPFITADSFIAAGRAAAQIEQPELQRMVDKGFTDMQSNIIRFNLDLAHSALR